MLSIWKCYAHCGDCILIHSITCKMGQQPKIQFWMLFFMLSLFFLFLSVAHPFKILFDSYFSSKNLLIHWKLKMTAYAMLLEVTKINRLLAMAKLFFPIPSMCSGQKNFQTWSICWYQYLILFLAFSNRRSWREVVKFSEKWPSFNMFKVFEWKSPETLKMD